MRKLLALWRELRVEWPLYHLDCYECGGHWSFRWPRVWRRHDWREVERREDEMYVRERCENCGKESESTGVMAAMMRSPMLNWFYPFFEERSDKHRWMFSDLSSNPQVSDDA